MYGQFIFGKNIREIHWGKNTLQQLMLENYINIQGKMTFDLTFTPQTKLDMNSAIQCNSYNYKLLEVSIKVYLYNIEIGKNFLEKKHRKLMMTYTSPEFQPVLFEAQH